MCSGVLLEFLESCNHLSFACRPSISLLLGLMCNHHKFCTAHDKLPPVAVQWGLSKHRLKTFEEKWPWSSIRIQDLNAHSAEWKPFPFPLHFQVTPASTKEGTKLKVSQDSVNYGRTKMIQQWHHREQKARSRWFVENSNNLFWGIKKQEPSDETHFVEHAVTYFGFSHDSVWRNCSH